MSRSAIVLPDATAAPIVALLQSAKASLRLKIVEFELPELIEAVAAPARRGVKVRVLFNKPGRGGVSDNAAARAALAAAGVEVADAPHKLSVVHEKSLVIDDQRALVMSCDWTAAGLSRSARLCAADARTGTRSTRSPPASMPTGRTRASSRTAMAGCAWCGGR